MPPVAFSSDLKLRFRSCSLRIERSFITFYLPSFGTESIFIGYAISLLAGYFCGYFCLSYSSIIGLHDSIFGLVLRKSLVVALPLRVESLVADWL